MLMIIPAVDLKNGKCVRLLQGRMEDETVFSDDPAAMAVQWDQAGAEVIHVIDLDGAFQKKPRNLPSVGRIVESVTARVQVGGGIRSMQTIEHLLAVGVERVIIGTEAVRNPKLVAEACRAFPGHIIVGIDARDGLVAIEGWTETTAVRAVDLARRFENDGVTAINFTDIARDGMQTGPNLAETARLARAVDIPVIASGGVASLEDIRNLLKLAPLGVAGVITGRAIYSGSLDYAAAVALARGSTPDTAA